MVPPVPIPATKWLTRPEVWCQIFADALNRRVEQVPEPMYAQLRGMAVVDAIAPKAAAANLHTANDEPEMNSLRLKRWQKRRPGRGSSPGCTGVLKGR